MRLWAPRRCVRHAPRGVVALRGSSRDWRCSLCLVSFSCVARLVWLRCLVGLVVGCPGRRLRWLAGSLWCAGWGCFPSRRGAFGGCAGLRGLCVSAGVRAFGLLCLSLCGLPPSCLRGLSVCGLCVSVRVPGSLCGGWCGGCRACGISGGGFPLVRAGGLALCGLVRCAGRGFASVSLSPGVCGVRCGFAAVWPGVCGLWCALSAVAGGAVPAVPPCLWPLVLALRCGSPRLRSCRLCVVVPAPCRWRVRCFGGQCGLRCCGRCGLPCCVSAWGGGTVCLLLCWLISCGRRCGRWVGGFRPLVAFLRVSSRLWWLSSCGFVLVLRRLGCFRGCRRPCRFPRPLCVRGFGLCPVALRGCRRALLAVFPALLRCARRCRRWRWLRCPSLLCVCEVRGGGFLPFFYA